MRDVTVEYEIEATQALSSDHNPVLIAIGRPNIARLITRYRISWPAFICHLENMESHSEEETDSAITAISGNIVHAHEIVQNLLPSRVIETLPTEILDMIKTKKSCQKRVPALGIAAENISTRPQ